MMAKQFPALSDDHTRFIIEQPIYFTATAAATGRVNLSPKGMDSLRVLSPNRVIWLNLTGSGNETAAHLAAQNRVTVMWCSFTTRPMILRVYGTARTIHVTDPDWPARSAHFGPTPGARQIFDMQIDLVQTSCGYAVPFMDYREERPTLRDWAVQKDDAISDYWAEKNRTSIDGFPTGIEANL
jgi:Pyridoxamine 5'-phosphate oxidase